MTSTATPSLHRHTPSALHRKSIHCLVGLFLLLCHARIDAQSTATTHGATPLPNNGSSKVQIQCLPDDGGYFSAHLSGSINRELLLSGAQLDCTGSVRPDGKGLRLRFSPHGTGSEPKLVLLFGVSGLKEGENGRALPLNLTIMREGKAEFYGTQGDDKCTVDRIEQTPIKGFPFKARSWRIEAHGFCTQPARALNGDGAVLVTRFDFIGRADFSSEDESPAAPTTTPAKNRTP